MGVRVLIVGEEAAGAHTLRAIVEAGYTVVAALTGPAPDGMPSTVARVAARLGTPVLPARGVRDAGFAELVRAWGVDVLLNVHSLHVIADKVLAAPVIGSFNLHPGLLPMYAGLNTVAWAIYNGETEHGVTVHWMAPRVDAGPIVFEERFPIEAHATSLTVSSECTRRGVRLLLRVLERASEDPASIPAERQDLSRRTYYSGNSVPAGGRVQWDRPAVEIWRLGRAFDYGPFPCPWGRLLADLSGKQVRIIGIALTGVPAADPPGTVRPTDTGAIQVACRDEWVRLGKVFADGSLVEAALFGAPGRSLQVETATHPSQGAHT